MSFMSKVFGSTGSNQPAPQQNSPVASSPAVPSGTEMKPDGSQVAIPKPTETLLDSYKDLHKPKAEGEAPGGIPVPVPQMNINEANIREAMAGNNFLDGVNAELIQKAAKGDAEAFMAVIQATATNAASAAFIAGANTTKRSLSETTDRFNTLTLPELDRRKEAASLVRKEMPFFEHPALKPMLSDTERRLADAYPNASAEAIKDHAKNVMDGMFQEYAKAKGMVLTAAPKDLATGGRDRLGNEDWSANGYFDGTDLGNPFQ